jgi:hypothetical protein
LFEPSGENSGIEAVNEDIGDVTAEMPAVIIDYMQEETEPQKFESAIEILDIGQSDDLEIQPASISFQYLELKTGVSESGKGLNFNEDSETSPVKEYILEPKSWARNSARQETEGTPKSIEAVKDAISKISIVKEPAPEMPISLKDAVSEGEAEISQAIGELLIENDSEEHRPQNNKAPDPKAPDIFGEVAVVEAVRTESDNILATKVVYAEGITLLENDEYQIKENGSTEGKVVKISEISESKIVPQREHFEFKASGIEIEEKQSAKTAAKKSDVARPIATIKPILVQTPRVRQRSVAISSAKAETQSLVTEIITAGEDVKVAQRINNVVKQTMVKERPKVIATPPRNLNLAVALEAAETQKDGERIFQTLRARTAPKPAASNAPQKAPAPVKSLEYTNRFLTFKPAAGGAGEESVDAPAPTLVSEFELAA